MRLKAPTIIITLFCCRLLLAETISLNLNEGISVNYPLSKPPVDQKKLRSAAFNLMINSISWTKNPSFIDDATSYKSIDGIVNLDVSKTLSPDQLKLLQNKNPYDCSKEKTGSIRADWLASQFNGFNYNKLLLAGLEDKSLEGLSKKIGYSTDTLDGTWKKALFSNKHNGGSQESQISVGERAVLFAEGISGPVTLTIDRDVKNPISTNPFILALEDRAGEMIFSLPNGLDGYALINNKEGKPDLTRDAPLNLVVNNFATKNKLWHSSHLFSGKSEDGTEGTISVAHQCMTCHRDGNIGPQRGLSFDEKSLKNELEKRALEATTPSQKVSFKKVIEQLNFLSENEYEKLVNKKNKRFHEALYKTHSFYSDPADPAQPLPLVAELEKLYDENVPFKLAASELGTTEEALRDVIKKSQAIRNKLYPNDFLSPSDPTLKRVFFETAYCDIKSALPQSQVVDKKTTAPIQEHSRIQKNH